MARVGAACGSPAYEGITQEKKKILIWQCLGCSDAQRAPLQTHGITLIALIITIILLLILAGVTIHFTLGENGILKNAELAVNKYKLAEENETTLLNEVNRAVTNRGGINEETIRKIVQEEIQKSYNPPTGIKTDIYLQETMTRTNAYQETTSITGFDSITKDSANKIDEYMEFSNTEGYKIKKGGWYFIWMSVQVRSKTNSGVDSGGTIAFCNNGNQIQWCAQIADDDSWQFRK